MPRVLVPVDLSDAEAAELAVWSDFFALSQTELLAEAVRVGLSIRRAEYEFEQKPPANPLSDVMDDDIPF